jgi:hypothetical protein
LTATWGPSSTSCLQTSTRATRPCVHYPNPTQPQLASGLELSSVPRDVYVSHPIPSHWLQDARTFLAKEGPKLQRYLTLKSWITDNYVTDWWEKYVYLSGRSPIMINSNYYVGDLFMYQTTTNQPSRAANLTYRMLLFKNQLDSQDLAPMYIRDTIPMCMAQVC